MQLKNIKMDAGTQEMYVLPNVITVISSKNHCKHKQFQVKYIYISSRFNFYKLSLFPQMSTSIGFCFILV